MENKYVCSGCGEVIYVKYGSLEINIPKYKMFPKLSIMFDKVVKVEFVALATRKKKTDEYTKFILLSNDQIEHLDFMTKVGRNHIDQFSCRMPIREEDDCFVYNVEIGGCSSEVSIMKENFR